MRIRQRSWIVVADSGQAHLFSTDRDETHLVPFQLQGLAAAEPAHHAHDAGSDRPGRKFSSAAGGEHHAVEPRHDAHKLEKHKFTAVLAEALNRACEAKSFDRLVLVVPPRTLGELRHLLSHHVQATMDVVPKDLTRAPLESLWAEVSGIVHHRPMTPA